MLALLVIVSASCAKHDFFDEDTITGKVGPMAYWTLGGTAVAAGNTMSFNAMYYSSKAGIDHSEVWYSIDETIYYNVVCPWVKTFSYSKTATSTEHKRVSQFIQRYEHDESTWNDSIHAYVLKGAFPVSGTLSQVVWKNPAEYDADRMERYFGSTFMQAFRDSLKPKMQFDDYRNMYLGLGLMEDFKLYTDSTEDKNAGEGIYVYHFPKDAEGDVLPWVVDSMNLYWEKVEFPQLIENAAENNFAVEYTCTYSIEPELRVFDIEGTYSRVKDQKDIIYIN